ncbi:hypothetical protein T4B_3117 [Trichinella pseudospiralis]|uniref:Uncharacterized protein n=1 Tax=Trichinella pseudospiralis TaxID=6337 RepID=A0A0V1JG04_TRIPS|nr:hypothetical protein T4A_11862 [Trichinella pseudospiralis]KRZ33923.1 hypothetical protein T4B_3117 [Trichinella pseudospiralis]KRZ42671.1 hypothetical protein T4C_12297 [Trichinella pseudospiralis]
MGQPVWQCEQNFIELKAHRITRFVRKDFYIDRIPNRSLKPLVKYQNESDFLFCTGMNRKNKNKSGSFIHFLKIDLLIPTSFNLIFYNVILYLTNSSMSSYCVKI